MILVDSALKRLSEQGKSIKIGVIGSGFMVAGLANQLRLSYPMMTIAAIAARRPEQATNVYLHNAKAENPVYASTVKKVEELLGSNTPVVTSDPTVLASAHGIDVVLEATGSMDFALSGILAALKAGKPIVLMNAELDATVGPYLKFLADQAGTKITNVDGDQPGVEMNLVRYVRSAGFKPVLCGSVKTLQDQHRNPDTQAAFAARWKQNVEMITSFADGSKVAFEQAVVANAAGMRVSKRGMIGLDPTNKDPTLPLRPLEDYLEWLIPHLDPSQDGLVDFVVGARPSPGVFVIGHCDDPDQAHYMGYYKMGAGPYYLFYTPYHLVHLEVPITIARLLLFDDLAVTPLDRPRVGVVATAKRDLSPGQIVDGIGGFDTYGEAENYSEMIGRDYLPMGLAQRCKVKRSVKKDTPLTFADVELPGEREIDAVYEAQVDHFS